MKGKITVVDDDDDLRNLLQITLSFKGFEVIGFRNGHDFLNAREFSQTADLYVIDLNLGGITGSEVCAYLKANPETKHALVILISANPEVQQLAKDACADDYIMKPFSQKELVDRVISLMQSRKLT